MSAMWYKVVESHIMLEGIWPELGIKAGVPSSVVWTRALGGEEAQGVIDMYEEVDDIEFFKSNLGALASAHSEECPVRARFCH